MDNGYGQQLNPCIRVLKKYILLSFDLPFSKLEIFSIILFNILGLGLCIIFNRFLEIDEMNQNSYNYQIFNTLSIISPFLGLYGSVTFKLKQNFKINIFLTFFFILIPLIVFFALIGEKLYDKEIPHLVASIYISSSSLGFFLLKLLRRRMQKSFGNIIADILTIVLIINCNLMFIMAISVLFLKKDFFSNPALMIGYIGGTWLVLLGIIWLVIDSFVFKSYPNEIQTLRSEILSMRNPSMQVQVLLSANPDLLKVTNDNIILKYGHRLASLGILVSMMCVEIGFIVIIAEYNVGKYSEEVYSLALFYSIVVPIFMFGGMVFSSSKLVTRDKFLLIITIGALVPVLLMEWLSYTLYSSLSFFYLALVIGIGFPASLIYWMSMAMIFQHNKRTYQYFSSILCMGIFIPVGIILPLYSSEGMKTQTFEITEAILLSAGLLLLTIWCTQLFLRLSKALCLLLIEIRSFSIEDFSLYLYSLSFILGYSILGWMIFKQKSLKENWSAGLISGCFVILALSISSSLFVHRVNFESNDPGSTDLKFQEIIKNKSKDLTQAQAQKKIIKKKSLILLGIIGSCISLFIGIPILASSTSEVSTYSGVTVIVGGFISTAIFLIMVELKHYLRHFGQKVISHLLSFCWLFCVIPFLVLIPVFKSSDQKSVTTWSLRLILLLIMVGVSVISIVFNYLFNLKEYEKVAKFCCVQVQEKLDEVAVKASLLNLREIYDNLYNSSPEAVEKVLLAQTIYSFREFGENDGDWEYSKEILTVDILNKIKHKGVEIKKIEEEKKDFSIREVCNKLFKRKDKEELENNDEGLQKIPEDDDNDEEIQEVSDEVVDFNENNDWLEIFKADAIREQEELEKLEEKKELERQRERERVIKMREDEFVEKIFEFRARLGFEKVKQICLDNVPVLKLRKKEKVYLENSKELHLILSDIDARKMWIKTVFEIFCTDIVDDDDEQLMNLANFKNFIKFSGLEQLIDSISTRALFERITKRQSTVTFDIFYFKVLPRLRRLAKKTEKTLKTEEDFIKQQLFPYLVNNIPALKSIISEFEVILNEYEAEITKFSPKTLENIDMTASESIKNDNPQIFEQLMTEDKKLACSKCLDYFSRSISLCIRSIIICLGKIIEMSFQVTSNDQNLSLKSEKSPKIPKKPKKTSSNERPDSPSWEEICKMIAYQFATLNQEAKEDGKEKNISLSYNVSNVMGIIGHVLEVYSFSSIGFNRAVGWNFNYWFHESNDSVLADTSYWNFIFWACFVCSMVFVVLLFPALKLVKKGRFGLNEDFTKAKFPSTNFFLTKFTLLFGKILYLTIMCAMLASFSCRYDSKEDIWILVSGSNIECFGEAHMPYLIVSIFTILVYYPTATLLFPSIAYQNRALDLKFDTSYLVLESQGKMLIAAFAVLFEKESYIILQLSVTIIVTGFLLLTCLKLRPCLVKSYNFWKTSGFLFPIWICTCALINVCSGMKYVFEIIFIPGLAVILSALVIVYWKLYGWCQCKKKENLKRKKNNKEDFVKDLGNITERAHNLSSIDNAGSDDRLENSDNK